MSDDPNLTDDRAALTPDFTPLIEVAKELGDEMVLDIVGRVGAHPYVRWTEDGWEGVSVGPWDRTDDGRAIISAKEIDVDDDYVRNLVEAGPIVQLVWHSNTPFDGYEAWEYGEPRDDSHE